MIRTGREPKDLICTGGEDLPVGTVFRVKGARKKYQVVDVISSNNSYNCDHCGMQHVCEEFQEDAIKYIPVCDWDKREDQKNVIFKKL